MIANCPDDPVRHARLRDLVDRAADLPAGAWTVFLERECPADAGLRAEARRLLEQAQAASAERFLDPLAQPEEAGSRTEVYPASEPLAREPTRLDKYQVVRRFSEVGGQAAAYLAFDPDLQRHVVLKQYHEGGDLPLMIEEGRALARIVSPYVARCHGVERDGAAAYLVVEYVPGRNLAEVRREGPLGLAHVVGILTQLAEGVAAVHACGLIHRDIKPANVILHDDGSPRLVDFGLATHLASSRLRELSGSPRYMAPEQARAECDRIDHRADVFGLGGVLYELLTGYPPHAGSTPSEVLDQARRGAVTLPHRIDPTIPVPLEAVCLKALAAAPENRYSTAREFAAALQQAVGSSGAAVPVPTPAATPSRRPVWKCWGLPAAAFACGLLALAGWLRPRDDKSAMPPVSPPISVPAAEPLQDRIVVNHFKELGDDKGAIPQGPITAVSLATNPPRLKDLVRVRVELSRPAYLYLIALNPDGKDQLGSWAAPDNSKAMTSVLTFPEESKLYFPLTDGVGLQAFVLLASVRPLPAYESWRSQVPGGLAWATIDWDGFCTYEASAQGPSRDISVVRGDPVRREVVPERLASLCDRLARMRDDVMVRAVAFPVKPDHEIIK